MCTHATFKEMIIKKPKPYRMPTLELNGKWLSDLGFNIGVMVHLHFQDGCLTLSVDPTAKCSMGILLVKGKRVRGRVRPLLLIDGFMLKRLGYNSYDRIGLTLSPNRIQMTRITNFTVEERDELGH